MRKPTKFVLGGFGNVGGQIIRAIQADSSGEFEIAAIAVRDREKGLRKAETLGLSVPIITADEAPQYARIIVECATFEGFRAVVEPALRAGCHVIAVSVGALGNHLDLIDLAKECGATLQIASGTLPGLDSLRAAREGNIETVRLEAQVLPRSLAHEPYIDDNGIDLDKAEEEPVLVFSGTARDAARHFPRHFNVAVALSLAGVGLDATHIQIHANGQLQGAEQTIIVKSDVVNLRMTSNNFPSPENNRTSRIVAPSIIAALRASNTHLRVGS